MADQSSCVVVLDTNIFLHYQHLEFIDWTEVLDASHVSLVVPPEVLRELNEKKDNPGFNYRDRAASAVRRLDEYLACGEDAEVRENVEISFPTDASIDYGEYGLDKDISDSRIVASAIEASENDYATYVATDDIGMKAIVRSLSSVEYVELPEKYRLDRKESEEEKELRRLREENRKLKSSQPKLSLCLPGEKEFVRYSVTPPNIPDVETKLEEKKAEISRMDPHKAGQEDALQKVGIRPVTPERAKKYNREREEFLTEYRDWLENDLPKERRRKAREIELQPVLRNEGSSPAENVEIRLYLTGPFTVSKHGRAVSEPPEPPEKPEPELYGTGFNVDRLTNLSPNLPVGSQNSGPTGPTKNLSIWPHDDVAEFRKDVDIEYEILYRISRLKHARAANLRPLYVEFHASDQICGFQIEWNVHADNLVEPVEGEMNVDVRMETEN